MEKSRRDFIKKAAIGAAGIAIGGMGMSAKSYARILGANDKINMAIAGVNGRGKALLKAIAASENTSIGYICDVDSRVIENASGMVNDLMGSKPEGIEDFRKLVEKKDLDAIAVATPEHWHTPMTIMGVQNDKHVYIEKPCSHNPAEGEMLVKAQKKYGKIIQMGNQQRSGKITQKAIKEIKEGIIGDVYYGKAFYNNKRGPIGTGKVTEVPGWLNWELWQGPAPRAEYKDNLVHYNWHWFWRYGTGEINNNGTHEIDICRWAMGLDYPIRATSAGGRFHYDDDWEFYDTQNASFEFEGGKMITWEGTSCNAMKQQERGRGAILYGTKGSVLLDRNAYIQYDLGGKVVKTENEAEKSATTDTVGAGALDTYHMTNFLNAIRNGEKQNSPINEGVISNHLCHLGNMSQKFGRSLNIDKSNGKIMDDEEAMTLWGREYEPGWEPKV